MKRLDRFSHLDSVLTTSILFLLAFSPSPFSHSQLVGLIRVEWRSGLGKFWKYHIRVIRKWNDWFQLEREAWFNLISSTEKNWAAWKRISNWLANSNSWEIRRPEIYVNHRNNRKREIVIICRKRDYFASVKWKIRNKNAVILWNISFVCCTKFSSVNFNLLTRKLYRQTVVTEIKRTIPRAFT